MIGMGQIKKKLFEGMAIGLAIGVVGIGLTVWWAVSTVKSYENGTNKKYIKNYTQNVTVLTKDVIQGETITDDMLSEVNVHKKTVPTGALDRGSIAGQVAKFNINANVPITNAMVTTEIISSDIRSQEVNTVLMPSDLVEGDKVDVRIMYPNGTDYIVLAQKNVDKISGQTMWIQLSEDERLLLNAAMVDSFLKQGTKLYATKYTDPDAQIKISDDAAQTAEGYVKDAISKESTNIKDADDEELTTILFGLIKQYKNFASTITRTTENYQPNSQVMDMMKSNKNILDQAKEKLSEEARANIENGISSYESSTGEDYENVVTGAQESIANQKTERENLITQSTTPTDTTTDGTTTTAQ